MSVSQIRPGRKPFFNRQLFPYGLDRSGDFTISESDLLAEYGDTLRALACEEMIPASEAETQFVAVARGEVAPSSQIELTWAKYQEICQRKKRFYGLTGGKSKPQINQSEELAEEDVET